MKYLLLLFITASAFCSPIPQKPKHWDSWNFSQKIAWRGKNLDPRIDYALLADKLRAKEFMEPYAPVAKLLYATNDPKTISTKNLPSSYVMKANNACNRNLIVKDGMLLSRNKDDNDFTPIPISDFLLQNYARDWLQLKYRPKHEKQYNQIKPMILFEELLDNIWLDIQFFCYYGKVSVIKIVSRKFPFENKYQIKEIRSYYDRQWQLIPSFHQNVTIFNTPIAKPDHLEEMIAIAEKLTSNIDHVRLDFLLVGNEFYFSEFTFTTGGNHIPTNCEKLLSQDWVYPEVGYLN